MKIDVEVAFALPERQSLTRLSLETPVTVGEAITLSGIKEKFPEVNFKLTAQGIFGHPRSLDYPLQQGDRVEIYRELINDPRIVRRERANTRRHPR